MKVGDLVVGRIIGRLGIITNKALKENYFWVQWCNGEYSGEKTLEWEEMLYEFNGGRHGKHILERGKSPRGRS